MRERSDGFIAPVLVATARTLLQQRLQPFFAHAIAPVGHRGTIERQPVLEKLLAAEVLVIGVLDPPLAHGLVAEVVGVFENGEPRHQPRRQRRLAGAILVNLAEFLFQKSPVDRPRQLRQRMIDVDDLIEPRTKHILLAGLPSLPWPHQILHASLPPAGESRLEIRGNSHREFARKSMWKLQFPAIPVAGISPFPVPDQALQDISRSTK